MRVNCSQTHYCPCPVFVVSLEGLGATDLVCAGSRAEEQQEWELAAASQGLLWGTLFHRLCWGFVFPSPSNEINTFTCHKALRMALGSFAFASCVFVDQLLPPASPPAQLTQVPSPVPLDEWYLCALLLGTLVALLPKETISLEEQKLVAVGHHAGLSLPWLGVEVSLMPSGTGGRDKEPEHSEAVPARDTPGIPLSSHCGTPTVHSSSSSKLEALCPWVSSRPFPKTPLPFPASPGTVWGRNGVGQGTGSIFRPHCFCSQTWQSRHALQLQFWQAQPGCFYISCLCSQAAPKQPSTEALCRLGPMPRWLYWVVPIPRGALSLPSIMGCGQYRGNVLSWDIQISVTICSR